MGKTMEKLSKRSEIVLKKIKPYQQHLEKRRKEADMKKQETDRISFIRNEIEIHANENDKKCRKFIEIQREISKSDQNIPEKRKLLLCDALDLFQKICISYPTICTAFFEARGAEALAQSFEMLLDVGIYNLLLEMFSVNSTDLNMIFHDLSTPEAPKAPADELQP